MYQNEHTQCISKKYSVFILNSFRVLREYYYIDRISISVLSIASIYSNIGSDAQKIIFNCCKKIFQRLTLGP